MRLFILLIIVALAFSANAQLQDTTLASDRARFSTFINGINWAERDTFINVPQQENYYYICDPFYNNPIYINTNQSYNIYERNTCLNSRVTRRPRFHSR